MSHIEYVKLDCIEPTAFLAMLNKQKIREHLIEHDFFDLATVTVWLDTKIAIDNSPGCRVRAVLVNNQLAGWCGIQPDGNRHELAVVLDDAHWGLGRKLFREMMHWAKELGHGSVFIHLLHTRPEYRFLQKIAKNSYKNKLLGNQFTTYELAVE
ncbi:MAG: N-acetyltransferase [Porticoccaceae bacterium]